jgi:thiol-disulfide isomerase/thioredoxin
MVENYHMKGDAYWMDNETLNKYIDRAQKIAPNVIGNLAPEVKMVDTAGKPVSLSAINSKYTLLIFWAADCGHCQSEMPKIDSLYKAANLKKRGVTVFAAKTNGDEDEKLWKEFIRKNHLEYWINVYDPERKSNYKSQYDVYATPMIYLLDDKKIIRGKKIDHTNILTLIDMLEEKEKKTSKN